MMDIKGWSSYYDISIPKTIRVTITRVKLYLEDSNKSVMGYEYEILVLERSHRKFKFIYWIYRFYCFYNIDIIPKRINKLLAFYKKIRFEELKSKYGWDLFESCLIHQSHTIKGSNFSWLQLKMTLLVMV